MCEEMKLHIMARDDDIVILGFSFCRKGGRGYTMGLFLFPFYGCMMDLWVWEA